MSKGLRSISCTYDASQASWKAPSFPGVVTQEPLVKSPNSQKEPFQRPFLTILDTFLQWVNVAMDHFTSVATEAALHLSFVTHGGRPLSSRTVCLCLPQLSFRHVYTGTSFKLSPISPDHTQSNGWDIQMRQILKKGWATRFARVSRCSTS